MTAQHGGGECSDVRRALVKIEFNDVKKGYIKGREKSIMSLLSCSDNSADRVQSSSILEPVDGGVLEMICCAVADQDLI